MEGIHIVAFAEEDDPGRRSFSSSYDSRITQESVVSHTLFALGSWDGEPQPAGMGSQDASGCLR